MYYFEVMDALYREQVQYLIVGGLSVNLHGVPRLTQDIDVILSMSPENVLKAVRLLKNLGFLPRLPVDPEDLADARKVKDWIENKNLKAFSFYQPDRPFEVVDIVLVYPLNFEEAYTRRVVRKLKDIEIPIACIDDVVAMKEFSGRDQDLSDVAMLKKVRNIMEGSHE